MRFRSAFPAVLGLLIAACAPEAEQPAEEMAEATTQDYESVSTAIDALARSYEEHYSMGHASAVADLYTDDPIVQGANSAVSVGREAFIASTESFMTAFSPRLTITPAEQVVVGDWVVDRGSYTQELAPEGGDAASLSGYYLGLSRRTDDGLRLHRLAVNANAPPTIPMPAPEAMEAEAADGGPIADLRDSYVEHYNMGHASMVADLWGDDGVSMFFESPAASGRAAIEASIAEAMAEGSPQVTLASSETIMLGEGWALDRGSFTVEVTVEGQALTRSGTYMVLCQEADDGTWKLHWGLSNAVPAPAM